MSVKVFNIQRGFEQDFVRLLMNKFPLASYSVNNKEPHDTVLKLLKSEDAQNVATYINTNITHIRGQLVRLTAEVVSFFEFS